MLEARNVAELPDLVQRLSTEIRSQYMLGYSSKNTENDGKYRKVKVELVQTSELPPLHIAGRRGYSAPED
jgi:Ca-activated chloride channel homolog